MTSVESVHAVTISQRDGATLRWSEDAHERSNGYRRLLIP